ncbi:hypothetical protein GLOIN_2v231230 [Rhizophagus clarus]|uniref:Uncharacterized protein n=1 Tax=Rhizophagus clarus TaxID=94130 RepID=A0A8H3L5H6_9GLOM|nr:hypothetical protein GLOIN_2v231230 [Rhizophagus clarus]
MTLKHSLSKKWQRVTESRYTVAFVILSIIQVITLTILQIRILSRNVNLITSIDETTCELGSSAFSFLIIENVMFVIFNLYQLYFCLNAIFHQNIMQLYTVVIIDGGYVILGIVQMIEVKENVAKIESYCPDLRMNYSVILYELPHIIVLAILAILIAALFFGKLCQQLDWDIYKKIGGDIEVRNQYRTILMFELLMKIDLFFVIMFGAIIAPFAIYVLVVLYDQFSVGEKILEIVCLVILILVFFFQALAYKSIKKEWKAGMIIFMVFWVFALVDFCLLAYNDGIIFVQYGLYSWIILLCILIICAILTFVYAIMVTRNFGKGLKKYLNKHRHSKPKQKGVNISANDNEKDIESGSSDNDKMKKFFTIDN